ncbi:integrase, catalytic region, zinc finger, CCHC-type containing protein [Tanacetum coccineum]
MVMKETEQRGNANPGQARQVKCYNCNGLGHIARNCTQPKRPQNSEYFKDKMLLMQAQENGVILDEEQSLFLAGGLDNAIDEDVDEQPVQDLALNVDNVFQADDVMRMIIDVDDAPHGTNHFSWQIYPSPIQEDEVTSLKKDFNQKENKFLEEFLDLKALKDKVEDKLFKQGQSIQTVHMMCKPRQVQLVYSGHVIITPNHASAVVRDGEETLELIEIFRKKMHEKRKANECVDNKMKAKALKEQNTRPIKALTVYPPNTPATLVPRVLPVGSR